MNSHDNGVSRDIRERAIRLLRDHKNASPTAIHNAIIDLRRNAEHGDEQLLRGFLDHDDPMVVAATLYTLFEVHEVQSSLRSLIEWLATAGDSRESDDLDKPIQCTAIERLASLGRRHDGGAIRTIIDIAEARSTAETPRARAWHALANLFDAEWPTDATEEMIFRPESEASERIRQSIREQIENSKGR